MGEVQPERAARSRFSMRVMDRKDFLKLGGAGLAGAALLGVAGCGGGGGGGGSSESGDIVFANGPDQSGATEKLLKQFNDQSKDFKVKFREMPADTGQNFDKMRTQFQAGSGDIDVFAGDVIWPAQFAANGWLLDVSDRFKESDRQDFLEGPIQSLTYEDKLYGVPWFTDAGMLYYRKDLLDKAGLEPPKTWDELIQQGNQIAESENIKFGFVFQGSNYEGGVCNGLEYIWTHGGDVLDPNDPSKVIIDSPEAAAGLATARSTISDGAAPQSVTNFTETESQTTFLNGDAVFCRNWPYMYALAANPDESKIKQDQVGIAPLPVQEGQPTSSALGGWNMMINANSQKQDQAWEFVQWMTAPEQQKFRALEGSFLPVRTALYDDQEVNEKVPVVSLGQEALKSSRPRPVSPAYSDMSLRMGEQFSAAFKGDVSPEEAVKTLQEELQSIADQVS